MESATGVSQGLDPSFWQVVKGDGRELVKVGYDSKNEPVVVDIVNEILFNQLSNGTGIDLTDEFRNQLQIKTKYLYVSDHHIVDPTTVRAILDLFINKNSHREIKFRTITFEPLA